MTTAAQPIPPVQPTAFALTPEETAVGITANDQHVLIPLDTYRALIDSAADAGRAAADADLQPRLEKLGFRDVADLLQTVEDEAARPPEETSVTTPAAPTPTNPTTTPAPVPAAAAPQVPVAAPTPPAAAAAPGDDPALDRRLPEALRRRLNQFREQTRAEVTKAQAAMQAAETARIAAEKSLADEQAATKAKIALVQAGVKDVDYAYYQYAKHKGELGEKAKTDAASKEALDKLDPAAWATDLRTKAPYVFGEQPVPATTPGPAGTPPPAAQTPAQVTGATAAAGAFDARTADPKAMKARMAELGINYSGNAPPPGR